MSSRRSTPAPSADPLGVLVDALADAVAARLAHAMPAAPTSAPAPVESEWRDTKSAARFLGLTAKTLQEWRTKGTGPKWHRLGSRAIRYAVRDLEAFARGSRS